MWDDWSTDALVREKLRLQTELSFEYSGSLHGGPAHLIERKALQKQIDEISAEIERRGGA